jgi:hypothetical protein
MLFHDEITQKGQDVSFSELPTPAKKAIIQYRGIEGDAWEQALEGIDFSTEKGWDLAIAAVTKCYEEEVFEHEEETFFYYEMPVDVFKDLIMQTPSDFAGYHDTFKDYHEWYIDGEKLDNYPEEERWPALAWCDNEGIIDGWHRTHDYVANGHKTIPLVL